MISLILADTDRSLFYLKNILINKIEINNIIYFSNKRDKTFKFLQSKNLLSKTLLLNTKNINSKLISKNINFLKKKIIYSEYPEQIIKNIKILKKKIIHFHPGDLPQFRGSTTIYYTLILKKNITVTGFIMNRNIDEGRILFKKKFYVPKNILSINDNFDHKIRASTLVSFLTSKNRKSFKKIKTKKNNIYYIAHPILRAIVYQKKGIKKIFN